MTPLGQIDPAAHSQSHLADSAAAMRRARSTRPTLTRHQAVTDSIASTRDFGGCTRGLGGRAYQREVESPA